MERPPPAPVVGICSYDQVPLNNLAKFFLETIPASEGSKDPVRVRFLGFAQGVDEGPTEGTLLLFLRLVE